MAVLPAYAPNETLGDGGNSLRLLHKEANTGIGIAHFGEHVGNAAVAQTKSDAIIASAEDAENKRISGLGDTLTRMDMMTEWAPKQAELQANIDPTGKDYTKKVTEAWDEHVAEYDDKYSGRLAGENQVLNAKARNAVVSQAVGYEANTRLASQIAVSKKITDDAGLVTAQNPGAFESVIADAQRQADILDFKGKLREPFMADVRRSAEVGLVNGYIARNPGLAFDAAKGAIAGFPKQDTPPEQTKVINAAKATDMDPNLMLAIGHIETGGKFNADAVSPNGFKGVFQTKGASSAYGAHDPTDTIAAGVATGTFLAARQQEMRDRGIDPTPGRTFMFHNLGEGVAWKLLAEKDPNKSMGQLLYDVYGDSKFGNGELKRVAVGKANPSLYNPDMAIADVRGKYEAVVNGAMTATRGFIDNSLTTDEAAKASLSKMTGVSIEQLGAGDLARVVDAATASLGRQTKADAKAQLGQAIFGGDVRMQPFNSEHKAAVDDYVKTNLPHVADDLVRNGGPTDPQGDAARSAAISQAGNFAREHSYLPHQWSGAMREAILTGDAKSPAKASAYAFLSDLQKNNLTAYDASGFTKDVTERLDLFMRGMERGSNPAQVLEFIGQEFSQDHKENKQALKSVVDNPSKQHPGEVQQLKITDITGVFKKDNGLWRAPIEPENSAQEELMMNAYRQNYKEIRYSNPDRSPAAAKDLALSDIKRSWGISTAFVSVTSAARFMQNPPDRFYNQPILGMKPFEEQARESVTEDLARRFPEDVGKFNKLAASDAILHRHRDPGAVSAYDASKIEVQIIPSKTTNDEIRSGSSTPSYQVAYRDPRNGYVVIANDKWQPNKDRMIEEATAAQQKEKAAAEQRRKTISNATAVNADLGAAGAGLQ